MPRKQVTGIYTITNLVNNKMYVGYASNILKRYDNHQDALISGIHKNPHLQAAWNYYGSDNFKFEELVQCECEHLASEEHYWATLLNVHDRDYGYNDRPTHPLDRPGKSAECKAKISHTHKQRFIDNPELITIALIRLNNMSPLEKASRKVWSDNERKKMSDRIKKQGTAHINNRAAWDKRKLSCPKVPVLQYDLSGNFVQEWGSMVLAATSTNIREQCISPCCRRVKYHNSAGGYIWRYKTDNYPLTLPDIHMYKFKSKTLING